MYQEGVNWREEMHPTLKRLGIDLVVYVPDAGHAQLIEQCREDQDIDCFPLVNEFEAVGICVGAWLGGRRACMLLQSSGVGNMMNALGLARSAATPFFAISTMRGEWGEFNPWQAPMGQATGNVLEAAGIVVNRAETAEDVIPVVESSGKLAFQSYLPVFTLISQRVTGAKVFVKESQP